MKIFESIGGWFKGFEPVRVRAVVALLAVCVFLYATYRAAASKEKMVEAKKAELASFDKMKARYLSDFSEISPLEKKLKAPQPGQSVGSMVEEMASGIGIKKNIASFKPLEAKAEKGYEQSGVEVKVEGVTLNQFLNLMYRMENHGSLLLVREFFMKSRFDNPELFDVNLHVELVSRRP